MKNQRGFTLIELLIVIGIMAILMAFAAPSMVQWRDSARIKGVASDILSGLRQARSLAITTNADVSVTLDPDDRQLIINGITRGLSANVGLATSIDDGATGWKTAIDGVTTFRPNGSCSAELYIRVNADDNLKVSIDSTASGLARL